MLILDVGAMRMLYLHRFLRGDLIEPSFQKDYVNEVKGIVYRSLERGYFWVQLVYSETCTGSCS